MAISCPFAHASQSWGARPPITRPSASSRSARNLRRSATAARSLGHDTETCDYERHGNWLQPPGRWLEPPNDSNTLTFNASGDPESDASLLFDYRVNEPWDGPDPNAVAPNFSGTYHLSLTGQAVIQNQYPGFSTDFTVQNQTYNAATNTTTADLVVPTTNTSAFFAIAFTNTQATPTSGLNTGFSNARLIRPGYAADSTQLFTNEYLAALQPYSVLRDLLADDANSQPILDGNNSLVTVGASQVDQTGLPWEYLITLANETNTDIWINIPQGATDSYVTALAGIFKNGGVVDGVDYPGLNANLKIYLEYSNEVWGGIPSNYTYQADAVQNSAANDPLSTFPGNTDIYENTDGSTTSDINTALGRRYLERTAEIGQIFQSVLGADPTHERIRPVLGWQESNYAFYPPALDWFQHFFGPAQSAFYGIGNANYFNPTDFSSVDNLIASLQQQEISYSIPDNIDFTTLATYYGLQNVSYEGGPGISIDSSSPDAAVALAASRDPRMEQVVYQHYINYFADGGGTAAYFDGPWSIWGPEYEWSGAELSQYGDPTASAKYRGTVDVADAAPVAVTAGVHVASASGTTFNAQTDTLGNSFARPTTGTQVYYLLNAASAGSYDLEMTTGALTASAPGQVEVLLGDQLLRVVNVTGSSTVDLGLLNLAAGLNTLSLVALHGASDPGQSNPNYYQFQPLNLILDPTNAPGPTVAVAAAAGANPVTGTSTVLSVLGADPSYAESALTYRWTTSSLPAGAAAPTFSRNGNNAANQTTVTFAQAGSYGFLATIKDPAGQTVTSAVTVNVTPTLSQVVVTPGVTTVTDSATQIFTATAANQFGQALAPQPAFNWSVDAAGAGGTITAAGLYTAPTSGSGATVVRAASGGISGTAAVTVLAMVPAAAASFVGVDTTTQGNWKGTYGADGYDIALDSSANNPSMPSYASLSFSGVANLSGEITTDPRGLVEAASGTATRVGAVWSGSSFSINLTLSDDSAHLLALYAVDWDGYGGGRDERIDLRSATSGALLDSRTLTNFGGGEYLVWNVTGSVTIVVTNLNPNSNATLDGVFLGGGMPQPPSANFVGVDTTTQGNWKGTYGADGYDIALDSSANNPSMPSYASLSFSGVENLSGEITTDPRGLVEAASGTATRVGAVWAGASFSINLTLSDDSPHLLALYAVDWDGYGGGRDASGIDLRAA